MHFDEKVTSGSDDPGLSSSTVAVHSRKPSLQRQDSSVEKSLSLDESNMDEQRIELDIHQLARQLTSQSHATPGTLFPEPSDGSLNPNDAGFSARKWAKAFFEIRKKTLEGNAPNASGLSYRNLNVYGFGTSTDFQKSVGNIFLGARQLLSLFSRQQQRIEILHDLEGVVHPGEMVAVLGPPGSGCSTFLKTLAGDTHGFYIADNAKINYQGIHPKQMTTQFRGEATYTAEVDNHFPQLSVGETLEFAASARCPRNIPSGITRQQYIEHLRDVTMAIFGILHTKATQVGDDFIRGVSGGERKRFWDNSTRGLDSANAIEFCRTLRTQADVMGITSFVAIYQAPQHAYDVFNKVLVLYEGRQIYFGKAAEAKAYFEELGFVCPEQQTTADFLTSMTSAQERIIRPGWEAKTPRTADEFALLWKQSKQRFELMEQIEDYNINHPFHGEHYDQFLSVRQIDQAKTQRKASPYTLSYIQQMNLTLWRSFRLLKIDPSLPITMLISNFLEALIASSIFYNLPQTSDSMERRGLLLFFILLINAFGSMLEILTLYAKRKIVEKHSRYALYHPSAEALSSMISDIPYKIVNSVCINVVLYFMANLRREPGPFFFFLLINFTSSVVMSMLFRLIGSVTKSIDQALAPSCVMLLQMVLYTGYAIPSEYMRSWIAWSRWANPVYYALESLMLNEFVGRDFECTSFVPQGSSYDNAAATTRACSAQGSQPGKDYVTGFDYVTSAFGYYPSHRWRNFGILIAFAIIYMILHLIATELVASERSKGEVLVFSRRALAKQQRTQKLANDMESGPATVVQQDPASSFDTDASSVEKQTSIFHWRDICYDITVGGEERRILDHVDGWVKPGTLTALMGASGAGKTTLLDVLASRVTMGVITGDMLVDGRPRDESFQRKTGYVQQQDLHLHTSTVREALIFSAILRQPPTYSRAEKMAYVDTVIDLLSMQEYSEAIIGVPGEGLNVEQRKRLTIGIELAARPQLLLFLDEPTSGLDSQTSWSICNLMEKLTRSGQAILCTIHQPSAMLFQRFDRLLLLSKGRTIYFGNIGKDSETLMDYFTRNGAPALPVGANPAEHILEIIGAASGHVTDIKWADVWQNSPEHGQVQAELARLAKEAPALEGRSEPEDPSKYSQFAASARVQYFEVTKRAFQQYWRSPSYIYSKLLLALGGTLFIGLSFLNGENTQRGLRNQMFGVFIFLFMFPEMTSQIMPVFVTQRTMYEARERPSKTYSWKAFMVANIVVEIAWNSVMSVFCFVAWYFPIGLYRNAEWTNQVHSRGMTMFLQVWVFFIFCSTFSHFMIAAISTADVAGGIANLLMILMFAFCGILAGPDALPGFWIFMYRINPFTYVVEAFLGTTLANAPMYCEENELVVFQSPNGVTCGEYLADYISEAGGYLIEPDSSRCSYCATATTNDFLSGINVSFSNRWRDFGIMWAYCIFNIATALLLYWLVRVPKGKKAKKD